MHHHLVSPAKQRQYGNEILNSSSKTPMSSVLLEMNESILRNWSLGSEMLHAALSYHYDIFGGKLSISSWIWTSPRRRLGIDDYRWSYGNAYCCPD